MTSRIKSFTNRLLLCVSLFGAGFLFTACQSAPRQNKTVEATEWLPRDKFQKFLNRKGDKDSAGKNFWDKGYSVKTIEGRWANGYQQYKIEIMQNPKDTAFWWMWYFDMDKKFFQKKLSDLSVEGYQLVSYSRNTTPTGDESFGGVWHKKAEK